MDSDSFKDALKRMKVEHLASKNIKKCSVPNCSYQAERGLFEIPKDDRRKIWIKNLGLTEPAKGLVCYNHFEDYKVSKFVKDSKPSYRLINRAIPKVETEAESVSFTRKDYSKGSTGKNGFIKYILKIEFHNQTKT